MSPELFFEHLEKHFEKKLPFVAYRMPHSNELIGLLQNDDKLYNTKDYSESGFVLAPFDSKETTVLIPLTQSTQFKIESQKFEVLHNSRIIKESISDLRTQHINRIEHGIASIKSKHLEKVVLSRQEILTFEQSNALLVLKRLLNTYDNAMVYCWYHPKVGLWLGATPETIVKVEGERFRTMALAGTQAYNGTLDVQWKDKERNEQSIVTNFIVNNLAEHANDIQVSEVQTIKAGAVMHLKTDISGRLSQNEKGLKPILDALHPTPAVCGYPKQEAKEYILQNENYNRAYYTGFLGEINVKKTTQRNTNRRNVENNAYTSVKTVSNLFVNLRCMQLKTNKAIIYVGGGITEASQPEAEWEETLNKLKTIKNCL